MKKIQKQRRTILNIRLIVLGAIFVTIFIVSISASTGEKRSIMVDKKIEENENQNNIIQAESMPSKYIIEINGISQDGIPTGCEAVSAVTALNYLGVKISSEEFIDTCLQKESFYYDEGVLYGANPEEKFVGDPYDEYSLGCFPPVIADAIEKVKECGYKGSADIETKELKAMSIKDICKEYIINNIPVLVWVTIDMSEPREGTSYCLEDGTRYTWKAGEHCMVLCGYDKDYYYFKDSLSEGRTVKYEKELVTLRYEQMGSRALAIFNHLVIVQI